MGPRAEGMENTAFSVDETDPPPNNNGVRLGLSSSNKRQENILEGNRAKSVDNLGLDASKIVPPPSSSTAVTKNGGFAYNDGANDDVETSNPRGKIRGSIVLQVVFGIIASIGHMSIGTANAYSSLALVSLKRSNDSDLQPTEQQEAWIGSLLPVGALAGSFFAGILQQRYGSVGAMKFSAIPFAIGWLLIGFAWQIPAILAGRVFCGMAIGVLAPASPTYVCEIAESRIRGALASIAQLAVTGGILLAYGVGAGLEWDWQARVCSVIPIIFFVSLLFLPESPVWLLQEGRREEAVKSLTTIRCYDTVKHPELAAKAIEAEIADIEQNILRVRQQAAIEAEARKGSIVDPTIQEAPDNRADCCQSLTNAIGPSIKMFMHRGVLRPLAVCWGLFFCQQMGGSSIVIFYTGKIFQNATDKVDESLATVIVGVVQFCATICATFLLDRLGRRPLLLTSIAFMGLSMASLGGYYYYRDAMVATPQDAHDIAWVPLASLVVYIIFYSIGIGPVPWFFIAELFPERARKFAGALGAASNLVLAFVTLFLFSSVQKWLHEYGTFWLFAACCALGFVFIALVVPETKGKTLEEIELYFSRPYTPAKASSKVAAAILRRRRKSSSVALGVASSSNSSSNESLSDAGNGSKRPYPTTLPTIFDTNKLVGFKFHHDSAY